MNQVSQLIYLADVAGNLGGTLIFLGILSLVVGLIFLIISCCVFEEINKWDSGDVKTAQLKIVRAQRGRTWLFVVLASFLWVGAAFTPSQNTVLAIAASQFGEQMLHTKTANLAEQALNSWLQKQITKVTTTEADKK